jgi:hypothetical protein
VTVEAGADGIPVIKPVLVLKLRPFSIAGEIEYEVINPPVERIE